MSLPISLPPVALAIATRDPTVAMIEKYDGTYTFPGGKVEPGEDVKCAALRELREETDLHGTTGILLGAREHPVTHASISYFWVPEPRGNISCCEPNKHRSVKWAQWDELGASMKANLFLSAADIICRLPLMVLNPQPDHPLANIARQSGFTWVEKPPGF